MKMRTYKTSEIAKKFGIHSNTVRLYEALELIPPAKRKENGYRVFTDAHIEQIKLARIALEVEVLQNGLRKQAVEIIKTSAKGSFEKAIKMTNQYLRQIKAEQRHAEEALEIVEVLLSGEVYESSERVLTRKETAETLEITIDALRNWEMNGLLTVRRRQNGYRVYGIEEMRRLKIIRALRCANYSLSSILRMLNTLTKNPEANIREVIDTPVENEDMISVCDKLISSLNYAEKNAHRLLNQLQKMKKIE